MPQVKSHLPAKILIVDDLPDNLRLLSTTLTQEGFDVRGALNGPLAIMGAATDPPDLILLDISMPEMDGFEVCHRLKNDPKTADIPIVFITALNDVANKVKGFELGGVDYITKPFNIPEVLARVNLQLELYSLKCQLQQQNQKLQTTLLEQKKVEEKIRQLNQDLEQRVLDRTHQLQTANENLQQEMQERQQTQAQLLHMAIYDSLTGLANRALLLQHLDQITQAMQQSPYMECLLILVDCDRVKSISHTLGHCQGDCLLIEIANRITAVVPEESLVARLGGDEFAIALTIEAENSNSADVIVDTLQHQLALPIQLNNLEININATIGMVLADANNANAEYLLRDAELAMVQAKKQQRGSRQLFKPEMHQQALYQLQLEGKLRQTVEQQQLQVYYQPIFALSSHPPGSTIVGYEALARWQPSPAADFIPPDIFIPLAEKTGLILALGDLVFQTACQQITRWNQKRSMKKPLFLSVNFSMEQLTCKQCLQKILEILDRTQADPHWIKLEVTESTLMKTPQPVLDTLINLRLQGIQVSIDDFGTGYSSLSYLKQLPIDTVKIDRTFIQDMESTEDDLKILKAILNLAQALELDVISEGIETEKQAQTLANLGCAYGQGYWFAKPLSSQQAEAFID